LAAIISSTFAILFCYDLAAIRHELDPTSNGGMEEAKTLLSILKLVVLAGGVAYTKHAGKGA
jgi:hypothetical protein